MTISNPIIRPKSIKLIRNSKCRLCPTYKSAKHVCLMGVGKKNAKIFFIGESPGEEEDGTGIPFVGKAGKMLDSIFNTVGIDRDSCFISNVIKCHPYFNSKPSTNCVDVCAETYLARELAEIRPQLIVCLGAMAARALLQEQMQIAHARNNIWYTKAPLPEGIPFIVTYHPAATFHNPDCLKDIVKDLEKAKEISEGILPKKKKKTKYKKVNSVFSISGIKEAKWIDVDTETDGLDPFLPDKEGLSIQLSIKEGEGYYLDWTEKNCKELRRLISNTNCATNYHNASHDLKWLRAKGNIYVDGKINCTLQNIHLLDENFANKSLDVVTTSFTDLKGHKDEFKKAINDYIKMHKRKKEPINKARTRLWKRAFFALPLSMRIRYGCGDADATGRLRRIFRPRIKEAKLLPLHNLMMDTIKMFVDIHCNGIKVDPFLHEELSIIYENKVNKCIERLDGYEQINHRSNQQVQELLYSKWKLPGHVVKSGHKRVKFAVNKEALDLLMLDPIGEYKKGYIGELLNYRKVSKLHGTYIKGFHRFNREGFIHATWNLTGAETGRSSCQNPNLQQLPRNSIIKRLFISRFNEGCLGQIDVSQGELRIMAHRANIKKMIHAFNTGLDIHTATAADGLGIPMNKVSEEERYRYKQANFSIGFGAGIEVAAGEMQTDIATAARVMANWHRSYPEWKEYVAECEEFILKNHYIRTLYGRYRHLFVLDPNSEDGKKAFRQGVNASIQGTLIDYNRHCGVEVWKQIRKEGLENDILIIGEVHDSFWFDLRNKSLRSTLFRIVKDKYENPDTSAFGFKFKVPMKVDVKFGPNLKDMKEYGTQK